MSVYMSTSGKTALSSILKSYSSAERDKARNAIINKVRFEMPKQKGLLDVLDAVRERSNFQPMNEYVDYLRESDISDEEFMRIFNEARSIVNELSPKFTNLVEALLAAPWNRRATAAQEAYTEFFIDLLVAHTKYVQFGIKTLISLWIPSDAEEELWQHGTPTAELHKQLEIIHLLVERIINAIPMSFDLVLQSIEHKFPYYKRAPHVVAGFLHNVLWLLRYKPIFTEILMQIILRKVIILDVNAPRAEIEANDYDAEENIEDLDEAAVHRENMDGEQMFQMDDCDSETSRDDLPMNHAIAQTLDLCMNKLYTFFDGQNPDTSQLTDEQRKQINTEALQFLRTLLNAFDNVILPSHNTHHVQFLLFYYCSFKHAFAETFLLCLWEKVRNPNVSTVIRQASVSYMASFMARSKFLSLATIKHYLKELSNWAHQYAQNSDQIRCNVSLKANSIFFAVCQATFYVIAFRSRDLTADKKSLLLLQSLQLSGLVTCNFNPLRVCLPAIATAFAGVTRTYQLAYCHAILERNARRKLATVYANNTATPEETLDTFFPFDPYLLKLSGKRIASIYLQYQASVAEEHAMIEETTNAMTPVARKRGDSEMLDDFDDFLVNDKRQKLTELAKSQERESQFTYGLSPGFHI